MITKYDIKTTFSETNAMKTTREKKFFIAVLIFYWLGIFIATHIPIPGWTRKMGISDKTMHFVAYMTLAMLLWLGTSFEQKADWKKLRAWLLTAIVLLYGVADEISQHFIKRSTDIKDFAANVLGIAVAMAIVTILPARHAAMIFITVCPLFLPAFVRSQLIIQDSISEVGIYLAGFAAITIAWIKYLSPVYLPDFRQTKLLLLCSAGPTATLGIVKLYAILTGKPLGMTAALGAFIAILLTLCIWRLTTKKNVT
jgi:hypothetical protein